MREMVSAGLLPLTSDQQKLRKVAERLPQKVSPQTADHAAGQIWKATLPPVTQLMVETQREALARKQPAVDVEAPASDPPVPSSVLQEADNPEVEAFWQHLKRPSYRMAERVLAFEQDKARGFELTAEQRALRRWFGEALDVAFEEEGKGVPVNQRTQKACMLMGAGGTGKTTIVLKLLLEVFIEYFPAMDSRQRFMITTFSHAQGDAISNEKFRAKTVHAAASYRVAGLRNRDLALKTKRTEMESRWRSIIFLIEDEVSLIPAGVQNMLLYRVMRARQNMHVLKPHEYGHTGQLF